MKVEIIRSLRAKMNNDEWHIMVRALGEFATDRHGNHDPEENRIAAEMAETLAMEANGS